MKLVDKIKDTVAVLPTDQLKELADFVAEQLTAGEQKNCWNNVFAALDTYESRYGDIILKDVDGRRPDFRIVSYGTYAPGVMEIEEMEGEENV